jgi:hypothetical protein
MALGFIADRFGKERALETAASMEYVFNADPRSDLFAVPG